LSGCLRSFTAGHGEPKTAAQEIFAVWMNSLDLDLGEGRSPLGVEVLCEDGATILAAFCAAQEFGGPGCASGDQVSFGRHRIEQANNSMLNPDRIHQVHRPMRDEDSPSQLCLVEHG